MQNVLFFFGGGGGGGEGGGFFWHKIEAYSSLGTRSVQLDVNQHSMAA